MSIALAFSFLKSGWDFFLRLEKKYCSGVAFSVAILLSFSVSKTSNILYFIFEQKTKQK
jgi:hypothetical protein